MHWNPWHGSFVTECVEEFEQDGAVESLRAVGALEMCETCWAQAE